jgi:hypothetical protein
MGFPCSCAKTRREIKISMEEKNSFIFIESTDCNTPGNTIITLPKLIMILKMGEYIMNSILGRNEYCIYSKTFGSFKMLSSVVKKKCSLGS